PIAFRLLSVWNAWILNSFSPGRHLSAPHPPQGGPPMLAGRRCRIAAALTLVVALVPLAASKSRALDPVKQRDEQKKIKARVDEAARRASSTLDAMMFQRLSPSAEQKMLREVADGLKGLSQEQIAEVLAHLEKAVAAPDEKTATAEQKAAYQKHLQ